MSLEMTLKLTVLNLCFVHQRRPLLPIIDCQKETDAILNQNGGCYCFTCQI